MMSALAARNAGDEERHTDLVMPLGCSSQLSDEPLAAKRRWCLRNDPKRSLRNGS